MQFKCAFFNGVLDPWEGEKVVERDKHDALLQKPLAGFWRRITQFAVDCFQRGPFASPVNEVTCGAVGAAIASENTRTRRRQLAGVEGTSAKAPGVER